MKTTFIGLEQLLQRKSTNVWNSHIVVIEQGKNETLHRDKLPSWIVKEFKSKNISIDTITDTELQITLENIYPLFSLQFKEKKLLCQYQSFPWIKYKMGKLLSALFNS